MKKSNKKKILIIGSSKLPVPATKGGAVPNLIEEIINENENERKLNITCISCFDDEAMEISQIYKYTKFIWVKAPKFVINLDRIITFIAKKILHINRLHSLGYFFYVIWFTFFVAVELNENEYDKVIFENSIPVMHSLRFFNNFKKYKGKYYLHIHTVPRKYYGNKKIIASGEIISISNFVSKKISERININAKKIHLLYNCIDINLFKPIEKKEIDLVKRKYLFPNNKKILLFAGRLCKDKGIDKLVNIIKKLNDDYILIVVGSNFYKTNISSDFEKKLINDSLCIKDRIFFTGYINYDSMPQIYNLADIVILPSMWDEPAGMTIIEGMACGKPVITTNSGGIPEYTGKNNSILVERDENIETNILNSIYKIDNDIEFKEKISKSALNRTKLFTKEKYYKNFIEIIEGENYV